MPYYSSSSFDSPFRSSVTKWVRLLLIANTALFVAVFLVPPLRAAALQWLALLPRETLYRPWTVLTYAFMHAGLGHWFFNMLALFFFGPRLEDRWGGRDFVKFYLIAAAGGALFSFVSWNIPVIGASAAVNGLLMAWAVYWPDEEIMFFGIFPMKIKWLVLVMAFLSTLMALGGGGGDGVAHLAHLGGFVTALAYLKSPWAPRGWGDLPSKPRSSAKKPSRALVPWQGKKEEAAARPAAPAATAAAPRRSARAERDLLDDVDRILDKISAQGLESLTPEERARLDEVSRRYRTN
jgi:membrane associated rhomboid family serine protease